MKEFKKGKASYFKKVIENINKTGLHYNLISSDGYTPAFIYTIGLTQTYKHPELILFGLPHDTLISIMNHAVKLIANGERLENGKKYFGFVINFPIRIEKIHESQIQTYLIGASWYYKSQEFDALQIVWPDPNGIFPNEDGFEAQYNKAQPLLSRLKNGIN